MYEEYNEWLLKSTMSKKEFDYCMCSLDPYQESQRRKSYLAINW